MSAAPLSEVARFAVFAALMQAVFRQAREPGQGDMAERSHVFAVFIAEKLRALGVELEPIINAELCQALVATLRQSTQRAG
jgi:hypothetical protein